MTLQVDKRLFSADEFNRMAELGLLAPDEMLMAAARHPTGADLVIEVSDTSLEFDRAQKSLLYAKAGIPEYWVIVVRQRLVEVRSEPSAEGYRQKSTLRPGEFLLPKLIDGEKLPIEEFLPTDLG